MTLIEWKNKTGMTFREIAEICGVKTRAVQRWAVTSVPEWAKKLIKCLYQVEID